MKTTLLAILGSIASAALTFAQVQAQQVTGTPGSPGATTTINGQQLPPPDPAFGGVIQNDALKSTP
ncbi:hypothetical protein EV560_105246 [Bosea sp. BK604]|nr:hypothetical protein EV560_105246 [Bosea sp. BK604]